MLSHFNLRDSHVIYNVAFMISAMFMTSSMYKISVITEFYLESVRVLILETEVITLHKL